MSLRSRHLTRIALGVAFVSQCVWSQRLHADWPTYAQIIERSDFVVHGFVHAISREKVPIQNLMYADPRPDATMGVIVLELEIRHVLKGYHVGSHFTSVVVPEGIAFIRTDYHIGDEVIVSAIYWKYMRGGSYTVTNDAGCFRKSGDKWLNALVISPNPPVEVELSEIEKVIASCRPEALLRIVEVAAIVRVESVSPTRPATSNAVPAPTGRHGFSTGASSAVTVEANVMDIIAGSAKGDTVIFHSIGTQFEVGQEWLVFLARGDSGLHVADPTNGLFRISGDSLFQADRLLLPFKKDVLIAFLKQPR